MKLVASEYQIDDDLDGVSNAEDRCEGTPINTAVDVDGMFDSTKGSGHRWRWNK